MSAAANPHPRTCYRADLDGAILAAAADLAARGQRPTTWRLSVALGESEATVRRHRKSLIDRGLWRWEVRSGSLGRPPRPEATALAADLPDDLGTGPRLTLLAARRVAADSADVEPGLETIVQRSGWSLETTRRHRGMLVGLGLWPWTVPTVDVSTVRDRAAGVDLSPEARRVLEAACTLVERGVVPIPCTVARHLGISSAAASYHRSQLRGLDLWPWPDAPAPPPEPLPGETEVRQTAAEIACALFEGQASPLRNDDARPYLGPWRAYQPPPVDPATVAARETAESCRRIKALRVEWRKLVRTWQPYQRGVVP